ncbi:Muramidase (phage lambda lysozyme) [Rhizobium sp. AN5]|uniref:hypothetical protein n=1 Tax=Rhizobium sp. AN5 TaxID=1855304 RepID=UPI000BD66FF3|nr:hypothetical protein [Rhizobium sp. AN5]SOC92470.1 Muramidase (phage lambda lysozyme) [Rhizobium sp. AN5]
MARVPLYQDTQQRVALRPEYTEKMTVLADPDAFGAGIGRGMRSVANGLEVAAEGVNSVRQLEDRAVVTGAKTDWLMQKDSLLYDPESGYANAQGKQAVDQYDTYKRRVGELKNDITSKLTPSQSKIFGQEIDAFEADAIRSGLEKRSKEFKSFVLQEHSSAAETLIQQAIQEPLNEGRWEGLIGNGLHELEQSGQKQGWGEQRASQERRSYISTARTQSALQIALSDPIKAVEYATTHAAEIGPQNNLVLLEKLKPDLAKAVSADAIHFNASNPASGQFAAQGMSRDTYALLSVIAGTESPGYDVMNGGQRIKDFAAHPGFIGAGGTTTASGRYQFVKGTWKMAAEALGLTDFSPANQDRAAAWLAAKDYRSRTGRDINADIAAGNYAAVNAGLGSTWEGLAKLSDADFAKRMASARSAPLKVSAGAPASTAVPKQSSQPAGLQFSPATTKILAGLPQAYADEIRASAVDSARVYAAHDAARQKATQTALTDSYKLRIANSDPTLSVADINDNTVIDDGDKAVLINAFNEKNKSAMETRANVAAFRAGKLIVDPYSEQGRKANDAVWSEISSVATPQQVEPLLLEQVRQTGAVPTSISNAMRSDLAGRSLDSTLSVLQLGSRIAQVDIGALTRSPNGTGLADDVALYRHYTNDLGLPPAVAAKRVLDKSDPEKARQRSALMETKETKSAIEKQATEANVKSLYSAGMFSKNPALGTSKLQSAAIVSDYKETLAESMFDAGGDIEAGKKLAEDRFKRRYGTSDFAMGGPNVVTRLPPEKTYPADANGSYAYIREQLSADLKADGVTHAEAFLVADSATETDVSAGNPPRYQVFFRDANGVLQHHRAPFYAKAPTPKQVEASKKAARDKVLADLEARRQEAQQELEAGRDREGNLDRFLAGPPSIFSNPPAAN